MGIVFPISKNNLQNFREKIRKKGLKDFEIKTIQGQPLSLEREPDRFVITYIEPYKDNLMASGLDLGSEKISRSAVELARDSGQLAMTQKITLVQDSFKRPGFLIFIPVYKEGVVPNSVQERRRDIIAFSYAPFVTEDFFKGALSSHSKELEMVLYEGNRIESSKILLGLNSKEKKHEKLSQIVLGQQVFTIGWNKCIMIFPRLKSIIFFKLFSEK